MWRAYAYAFTFYGPPITPREAELQHIARVLEAKREERRELLIIAAFLTCLMVATYIFRVEGERDLANKVIDCLVTGQSRDYCEESVRY